MSRKIFLKLSLLVVAVLVGLELALHVYGWILIVKQGSMNKNNRALPVIVTLGESTTSDMTDINIVSWPRQLEILLRDHQTEFKVVNLAMPGVNTPMLLKDFMSVFYEEPPRLVIAMMGVNDRPYLWPKASGLVSGRSLISQFKLLKLLRLLLFPPPSMDGTDSDTVDGSYLNYPSPEALVQRIKKDDLSTEYDIHTFLGDKNDLERAQFYSYIANQLKPPWGSEWKEFRRSHIFFRRSLELSLKVRGSLDIFSLVAAHVYRSDCQWLAERILETNIRPSGVTLNHLSDCLPPSSQLTADFFRKYGGDYNINLLSKSKPTGAVYRQLQKLLSQRGICLIAMGYPLEPIKTLQESLMIVDSPYIHYVENYHNFTESLQEHDYKYLFTDRFAGHFGHGTDEGNKLLAVSAFNKIKQLIAENKCGLVAGMSDTRQF